MNASVYTLQYGTYLTEELLKAQAVEQPLSLTLLTISCCPSKNTETKCRTNRPSCLEQTAFLIHCPWVVRDQTAIAKIVKI